MEPPRLVNWVAISPFPLGSFFMFQPWSFQGSISFQFLALGFVRKTPPILQGGPLTTKWSDGAPTNGRKYMGHWGISNPWNQWSSFTRYVYLVFGPSGPPSTIRYQKHLGLTSGGNNLGPESLKPLGFEGDDIPGSSKYVEVLPVCVLFLEWKHKNPFWINQIYYSWWIFVSCFVF